jgi:hypothetical protein
MKRKKNIFIKKIKLKIIKKSQMSFNCKKEQLIVQIKNIL